MHRPTFLSFPAVRLARAAPLAAGRGRRIRLVSVLAVVAGALLAPLAGAAPAYAQTGTECILFPLTTTFGLGEDMTLTVIGFGGLGGPTPTGAVTFTEGGTTLETTQLDSSGDANLNTGGLSAGTHQITATYNGDANFSGCSDTAAAKVSQASTTTRVTSSPNPSGAGQPVTFTATVSPLFFAFVNDGTVTFFDGATQLGNAPVATDKATFTTSALAPGSHQITAAYSGDTNYTGSTSTALTQTVADNDLAISTPGNITVDATGPSGAAVSYPLPAVSDPDDATAPTPACSPASGTTFAIASTTVTCTAIDLDDTPSTVSSSFTITVRGAADQLAALGQAVKGAGPGTSLADKITAAQSYLASGDTADACSTLTLFINQVKAQSGKSIPAGQAAQLIADATRIRAVMAC
jgi:large repetitive protein